MNRIFLSLAIISNLFLAVNYVLGWSVRNSAIPGSTGVGPPLHFLCGVGAIILAMLVHAIVLTYFMGTGRWIEETTAAYSLGAEQRTRNIHLKYRTLPAMVGCLLLWIIVAAFGAAAHPGAAVDFAPAKTVHMTLATLALLVNIGVSFVEYDSICRNHELITAILERVHSIRRERGLDPA